MHQPMATVGESTTPTQEEIPQIDYLQALARHMLKPYKDHLDLIFGVVANV